MAAFEELKKSRVNWTFFSPAAKFDYAGKKTGRYILGTDYLIRNADGESRITYADYAIAMADEAEQAVAKSADFTVTEGETPPLSPVYSQRDGWWENVPYRKSNLSHSGCAIFTLSHALQR